MKVLKQYADFSGRARRKEYWMFYLFNCIIAFVLLIPFAFINDTKVILFIGLYFIYALGVMIPSIAVLVRRLHDIDKSGWWYFISFVPFIGSIWLLVLLCTEGTRGRNSYGPDPKETEIVDISF